MRKKKRGAVFLCAAALLLCMGLTALYTVFFIWRDDTRPPVISMTSDTLEVPVSATDDQLLAGVTAVDDRDGDVTADILIQGVSDLVGDTVTVTYAAFDSAGNVSKAVRTVRYTDYQPPRLELNDALVFTAGTTMDVLGRVTATDMMDGDLSGRVKAELVSNTTSLSYAGVHQVEFRVTNSLGDTSYLTVPVDVLTAGDYNAAVELKDYLLYLPKGRDFNPRNYLRGLRVSQSQELVESLSVLDVDIDNNVNINVPGVYSVCYTVTYDVEYLEYVGYTRMIVVVED